MICLRKSVGYTSPESPLLRSFMMGIFTFLLILLLAATIGKTLSELTPSQRQEIERILSKDQSEPPFYSSANRTRIRITLHMTGMRMVDKMEGDFTFYYYQIWDDERLRFPFGGDRNYTIEDHHVVRQKHFKNLWLSESYIENELHSRVHDSSISNQFVWLLPNGTLVYSMRMTVGLSCKLRGVLFPNGIFSCLLKFRIHSYTKDQVYLEWDTINKPKINTDFDNQDISLHSWELSQCSSDASSETYYVCSISSDGSWVPGEVGPCLSSYFLFLIFGIWIMLVVESSCLEIKIYPKLNFVSSAVRLFMPSVFIVLVGWLSFWIERSEVSARVKLGTLCLLSMITEQVGAKFFLPVDFHVYALEVWFIVSLSFVVVAMLEYTFVHAVDIYQDKVKQQEETRKKAIEVSGGIGDPQDVKQRSNQDLIEMNTVDTDGTSNGKTGSAKTDDVMNNFWTKYIMMVSAGKLEKYFRIFYAVTYLVFQFMFWTIVLNYEERYD